MRFTGQVIAGNALLLLIVASAAAVCIGALLWSAISSELRELFETPQEKEQD